MVVVKYLSQFGFFPWNSIYVMTLNVDKPFFPPRILGLEKSDNYIRYDLLQLLALFFHRSLLMVSPTVEWKQHKIFFSFSFFQRKDQVSPLALRRLAGEEDVLKTGSPSSCIVT